MAISSDTPVIDFSANFRRYQPAAVAKLGRIERALGAIRTASIIPPAADQMRASALAGTVHYSTLIEGNELPLIEAERAAARELDATTTAKLELVNYVEALALIDKLHDEGGLELRPNVLLEIHGTLMRGLGREDSDFKPHHEGAWRDGRAVILDQLDRVIFEGAPADEVPARMAGVCDWLRVREDRREEFPPPVLAAVAHYAMTEVHPFANGNGRMARLTTSAILLRDGYLPGRLFCFDGYYARDKTAYLNALRSVRERTLNMETWLEYFLEALAEEYERVQAEVEQLNRLGLSGAAPVQLKASQQRGLSALAVQGVREFTRADYERAAGVQRVAAGKDINDLTRKRILRRVRTGPRSAYTFARGQVDGRGRPRAWTPERIRAALEEFTAGRTDWPTVAEFKEAGRTPLYLAISRYGGAEYWAAELGLRRR